MKLLLSIFSLLLLSSCGRYDDFYTVSKVIYIPDTILVDQPFPFTLVLRNDSSYEMQLTIDEVVQKSVFFRHDFSCAKQLLTHYVANPERKDPNYRKHYLKPDDSLAYNLVGLFKEQNDSFQLIIKAMKGYTTSKRQLAKT